MNSKKNGFTLVELSLSIAFISILSIIIVIIINNTISSYHRGLTLNKINSTGMDLVDDIRSAIQNSSNSAVTRLCSQYYPESTNTTSNYQKCYRDGARNFVAVVRLADVSNKYYTSQTLSNVPVFGAFCTGTYSYIWNSGYFFSDDHTVNGLDSAQLKYLNSDGTVVSLGADKRFKLLKIEDEERAVCVSATFGTSPTATSLRYTVQSLDNTSVSAKINNNQQNVFDITEYQRIQSEPIDILTGDKDSDNGLALYDLWSAMPAESKSNYGLFYIASFVLGTIQGGINVNAAGNFCSTPGDYPKTENLDYCAINKFNIASQAMGASK